MEALKMRLDPDKMEVAVLCFVGWADARVQAWPWPFCLLG